MNNKFNEIRNEMTSFQNTLDEWEARKKKTGWASLEGTTENSALKNHAKVLIYKLRKLTK